MKTIGIVGGIGPESTIDYYKQLLKRAPELGSAVRRDVLLLADSSFIARRRTPRDGST